MRSRTVLLTLTAVLSTLAALGAGRAAAAQVTTATPRSGVSEPQSALARSLRGVIIGRIEVVLDGTFPLATTPDALQEQAEAELSQGGIDVDPTSATVLAVEAHGAMVSGVWVAAVALYVVDAMVSIEDMHLIATSEPYVIPPCVEPLPAMATDTVMISLDDPAPVDTVMMSLDDPAPVDTIVLSLDEPPPADTLLSESELDALLANTHQFGREEMVRQAELCAYPSTRWAHFLAGAAVGDEANELAESLLGELLGAFTRDYQAVNQLPR